MEIKEYKNDFSFVYRFYVFGRNLITVSKHKLIDNDNWEKAVINWRAIGDCHVQESSDFSRALKIAVDIAEKLDIGKNVDLKEYNHLKTVGGKNEFDH